MATSFYNRKKQFLAPFAEGLVKQLTGFEEDNKDYGHVLGYVYTQLFEHNFATVDIINVQKSLKGIAKKLKIHGLHERSNRFLELVEKYVSSDSSHHTQLNVQWNVLLLLLKLSYKPTSLPEVELKSDKKDTSVPEEITDWAQYLNEDWKEYHHRNNDSDDDEMWRTASEDEDESEKDVKKPSSNVPRFSFYCSYETDGFGSVPHPSLWRRPPSPTPAQARTLAVHMGVKSEQWLRDNVQTSWWNDSNCRSATQSKRLPARMFQVWERQMATKQDPRDSFPLQQFQVVSEFKVLHEILWMLQASTNSSLFILDEQGRFNVKPNVSLPSTVPGSLQLVLEGLCPYFDMVKRLELFEAQVAEQELSGTLPPATYKAYCAALYEQLAKLTRLAIHIQTRLNKQDETMTLLSVVHELMPGLKHLKYLDDTHTRAVQDWQSQPNWLCATRLLSVLYEALLEASDEDNLEASLYMFIHSFHVYLDIIDVWLSEGNLEDWRDEFLVIREGEVLKVMPYEEEMKKCGVLPVSLLSKLVRVVSDAGHTMEVVSQLNKLPQLRDIVSNKGCLFKEFSENIYNEISRLKQATQEEVEPPSDANSTCGSVDSSGSDVDEGLDLDKTTESDEEIQRVFTCPNMSVGLCSVSVGEGDRHSPGLLLVCPSSEVLCDHMLASLLENPLLSVALRDYLPASEPNSRPPAPTPFTAVTGGDPLSSASLVSLMSIHSVLERQLDLVVTRHKLASRLVTQTLRTEYNLLQHFTVLRNIFFMENGSLAQSFYSYLFKEILSGAWNNSVSLSMQLQMIVEEFYPGFGNYFTVVITKTNTNTTCDVHRAIPSISLDYKVDWPVSSVVTQEMIVSYNKVFRFLLHLKFAFWTLHNIRFSDLVGSRNWLRVRRLQVLKCWMYHSTNTLHTYFMGLVLRSFSKHLDDTVQMADSIDIVTEAHNKFLEEIKVHCLQDKKTYIETFIMKLLRLCSLLSDQWEREASGSLTDEDMQRLEQHYVTAYNGLVHCLDVLTDEEDAGNFLFELKSEFAHSVPGSVSVNIT